jgi:DegV family protein with EDD domain
MESICLLTDGSAQYSQKSFRGIEHIYTINQDIQFNNIIYREGRDLNLANLPLSSPNDDSPKLIVPEVSDLCQKINTLGERYDYLIAILSSRQLNPLYGVFEKAVLNTCGKVKVQLIDSQAVSSGLGYLVETAAKAVADKRSVGEIEHLIRKLIPHVYTTLCTPGFSYLLNSGYVDHAQAAIGEMLGLFPIFTLEDGRLAPIQKVRSDHSIFEYFQEFLDEFEDLIHIAFIQNSKYTLPDSYLLRDHIHEIFNQPIFTEMTLNSTNAVLFGPRTLGLTVVEKSDT